MASCGASVAATPLQLCTVLNCRVVPSVLLTTWHDIQINLVPCCRIVFVAVRGGAALPAGPVPVRAVRSGQEQAEANCNPSTLSVHSVLTHSALPCPAFQPLHNMHMQFEMVLRCRLGPYQSALCDLVKRKLRPTATLPNLKSTASSHVLRCRVPRCNLCATCICSPRWCCVAG
jgi:hypothetical protein